MRSTRSTSRGRTSERGFVLGLALVIALLYFGLMELYMIDSSRALGEAQRFRARVTAQVMAENAAELCAVQLVSGGRPMVNVTEPDAQLRGVLNRVGPAFELGGQATTSGVPKAKASVTLQGRIEPGNVIRIDWSNHSQ